MVDRKRHSDVFFETGKALIDKPRGRPQTIQEPRDKILISLRRSALRELESIKRSERDRLEKIGDKKAKAVSVTSLIAQAVDVFIAKHKGRA